MDFMICVCQFPFLLLAPLFPSFSTVLPHIFLAADHKAAAVELTPEHDYTKGRCTCDWNSFRLSTFHQLCVHFETNQAFECDGLFGTWVVWDVH